MASLDQFVRANGGRVAAKVIDGEAILIDMSTGNYFSMADTAGFIWSLIEQGATLGKLADAVADHYQINPEIARADVTALAQDLSDEGLIDLTDEGQQAELEVTTAAETGLEYTTPSYEKFSDMAEMFALDPPLPGLARKD